MSRGYYSQGFWPTPRPQPKTGHQLAAEGLTEGLREALADRASIVAAGGEDSDAIQAVDKAISRYERMLARNDSQQKREVAVSRHDDAFRAAMAKLTDGVQAAGAALRAFDKEAAEGRHLPAFVAKERQRLTRDVQFADRAANEAIAAYRNAASFDALTIREEADASADSQARLADEMERARLVASPMDASALLARAQELATHGQPRRAALFIAAAQDKGGSSAVVPDLARQIEDALDADEGSPRHRARVIEDAIDANTRSFESTRLQALADSGLGIAEGGTAGWGASGQKASASAAAKLTGYLAKQAAAE